MASLVNERRMNAAWLLLAAAAGSAACGSDDSTADDEASAATETEPNAPTPPVVEQPPVVDPTTAALAREMQLSSCVQRLDAHGVAFVDLFFAVSDYCPTPHADPDPASTTTLEMLRDGAGKNCMRGRITDGWGELIVGFDGSNRNGSVPLPPEAKPLDADSAGIDGVQFTLDTPPTAGLTIETAYAVGEGCFPGGCELHADFYVMEANGATRRFDQPGTYSLRFADFQQAPSGQPVPQLDTTHIAGLFFHLPTGDFDFCVNDFHFLDVNGAPVL